MNVPAVVRLAARRLARLDLAPACRPFSPARTAIRQASARRDLLRNFAAAGQLARA